ncbi:MAG: FKBP-type peptidyl-prolyl cis-trans isomerase, partial [Cyclobacteriaceae bacterium]|nr:FKBP-type peptidyl-prolyl cis-trans isomerase [Cyclobacteriaceae bacterium]
LLDGTKFDSSLDRNQPFDFKIGVGGVIMGWDIGIPLLKKGGKGTLYIPSPLAYGEQGAGGIIKPNSVLKFDVELIDIEQIN